MKRVGAYIILMLITEIFAARAQSKVIDKRTLVPIDFSNPNYAEVEKYAIDTVTADGWAIKYFVRNDQTKYDDIYIQWSKGTQTGIFCDRSALKMRRFFIPVFAGENDTHIFMTHRSTTTCEGLLTLSKKTLASRDFPYVIDYDIASGQLVYIPERSYSLDELEVSVFHLEKKREKSAVFENKCNLSPEEGCISRIDFNANEVWILTQLRDKNDETKVVGEIKIVRFGE